MDALTLGTFLSPILTVTTVWNTGETGDMCAWIFFKMTILRFFGRYVPVQ